MSEDTTKVAVAKRSFRRAVAVLVGGTALGHLITASALPVVTRLYSPMDFSVLAVFSGIVFMVSVAACLRFDVAIQVAVTDDEAANLLGLAIAFAVLISGIVGGAFLLLPTAIQHQLGLAAVGPYLWWLPFGIFLAASYGALQGWYVRRSAFGLISRNRVSQSVSAAGGQVGLGWLGLAPVGLLIGFMLNTAIGCLVFGYRLISEEAWLIRRVTRQTLQNTFRAYSQYPKYSTFEALANSAAIQVPVIMIAALAIGPEAGYLALAMAVMQAPMALIGNAIGQVYLSRAPDAHQNGTLGSLTAETLAGLSRVGIGPLLFAGIVAPDVFALVFGADWRRAGEIVAWMTPWFVAQFLASPLSMAIHVTGNQRLAFGLQIAGIVLRVGLVWAATKWWLSGVVEIYAISGLIFYFAYFISIITVTGQKYSHAFSCILQHWRQWVIWGVASAMAAAFFHLIRVAGWLAR